MIGHQTSNNNSELIASSNKELSVTNYINDIELDRATKEGVKKTLVKERESTRKLLATWLVKIFGVSVIGNIFLAALLAFYPKADTSLLEKLLPIIISPQVTLLGVALGFYYGQKEEDS